MEIILKVLTLYLLISFVFNLGYLNSFDDLPIAFNLMFDLPQLFPDFLHRKAILKTLGYLDENEAVAVKGRVACEVNSCEELIVTEMVFEGILNELDPTEIVAALSALVYQQKSTDEDLDIEASISKSNSFLLD